MLKFNCLGFVSLVRITGSWGIRICRGIAIIHEVWGGVLILINFWQRIDSLHILRYSACKITIFPLLQFRFFKSSLSLLLLKKLVWTFGWLLFLRWFIATSCLLLLFHLVFATAIFDLQKLFGDTFLRKRLSQGRHINIAFRIYLQVRFLVFLHVVVLFGIWGWTHPTTFHLWILCYDIKSCSSHLNFLFLIEILLINWLRLMLFQIILLLLIGYLLHSLILLARKSIDFRSCFLWFHDTSCSVLSHEISTMLRLFLSWSWCNVECWEKPLSL